MTETADNHTESRDHVAIPQAGRLGRLIDKGAIVFAAGIVLAMLILINEVFLRYVLNAPTIWAHETTIFLCGIAFLYGGLLCTARDRHIRVVLIYDFVPKGLRRYLDVVISLICAAASLMFAWAAWLMVARAAFRPDGTIRLERSGSAWDPAFPGLLKIFLLVIMSVMALQFAILAVNYLRGRR
ncbi:TRAP transporter small permease subunit [Pannonibacter carbonis]|uniref:TRAP transporter small permease subunit n=1 Tax=Pannonibacter carbonis TaxID=2067569 RepID=UPI001AD92FE4|nr:TRAP transporter small permease [Pannonibacter carbonis]